MHLFQELFSRFAIEQVTCAQRTHSALLSCVKKYKASVIVCAIKYVLKIKLLILTKLCKKKNLQIKAKLQPYTCSSHNTSLSFMLATYTKYTATST